MDQVERAANELAVLSGGRLRNTDVAGVIRRHLAEPSAGSHVDDVLVRADLQKAKRGHPPVPFSARSRAGPRSAALEVVPRH